MDDNVDALELDSDADDADDSPDSAPYSDAGGAVPPPSVPPPPTSLRVPVDVQPLGQPEAAAGAQPEALLGGQSPPHLLICEGEMWQHPRQLAGSSNPATTPHSNLGTPVEIHGEREAQPTGRVIEVPQQIHSTGYGTWAAASLCPQPTHSIPQQASVPQQYADSGVQNDNDGVDALELDDDELEDNLDLTLDDTVPQQENLPPACHNHTNEQAEHKQHEHTKTQRMMMTPQIQETIKKNELAGPAAHIQQPQTTNDAGTFATAAAVEVNDPFASTQYLDALGMLDLEAFDNKHALLADGTCEYIKSTQIPTPMHPSFIADSTTAESMAKLPVRAGTTVAIVHTLLPQGAPGGAWAVLRDPTGEACAAISAAVLDDQADLDVGAAVVLRRCAIFPSPVPRRRYLAVLPHNVLAVFGPR